LGTSTGKLDREFCVEVSLKRYIKLNNRLSLIGSGTGAALAFTGFLIGISARS